MDLSKIDGLTEEQQAAINSAFDEQISGIKKKNDILLGEKKTAQQTALEKEQALEDAREAATKAKEDALKLAGDVEGLKKHYEEQLAESTATANAAAQKAQEALLSRDKSSFLNATKALIHDDYKSIAEPMLSNMLKVGYNDEGQAIATYEHEGKVIANNVDEFLGWAEKQEAFKKILNGVDSSGAGTQQSSAGGGGEMTLTERAIWANKNPGAKI